MEKFLSRKESILSIFTQAKTDLEDLNVEITETIANNEAERSRLAIENENLQGIIIENKTQISAFAKFFGLS